MLYSSSAIQIKILQSLPPPFQSKLAGIQSPQPSNVRFRRTSVIIAAYASVEQSRPNVDTCLLPPKLASASSFYEVLGLPMGATGQEIKAAYRRLARACHPDVVTVDRKDSSADEFMKIHAAYSTLSDPDKRADYDRRIFRRPRPVVSYSGGVSSSAAEPVASRFRGYTRRSWESDQCW